ncbi:MAG: hypothetical protein V7741_03365, partial [Hyphomonas sp.]
PSLPGSSSDPPPHGPLDFVLSSQGIAPPVIAFAGFYIGVSVISACLNLSFKDAGVIIRVWFEAKITSETGCAGA